jgi:hypothetical protein
MSDAVKITELPEITTLQPADIIPVVDSSETQTSRATLEQIQNLGPGDDTVSTDSLKAAAVTAAKTGYSQAERIHISSALSNNDGVNIGEEIPCTTYIRTLLAAPDATQAWQVLSASPNFYGQVTVPPGTPTTPSYSFTSDETTGMFAGPQGFINFSCLGDPVFSVGFDRTLYTLQPNAVQGAQTNMTPFIGANAMLVFDPGIAASTRNIYGASNVGAFFGFPRFINNGGHWDGPSLANEATTRAGVTARLQTLGYQNPQFFSNWFGDNRTTYTSTWDNRHIILDANGALFGSGGVIPSASQVSSSSYSWIARLQFSTIASAPQFKRQHNIAAIENITAAAAPTGNFENSLGNTVANSTATTRRFKVTFQVAFPDENYMVYGGSYRNSTASTQICCVDKRTTYCIVDYSYATSTHDNGAKEFFLAAMR